MTGIVTGFLTTKNSIYLTTLSVVGLTAPFWHIVYGIRDTEGIFGYRFMSSFLNSLGTRLCFLCLGLLLLFFSNQINNEFKKIGKGIAYGAIYVGCYFLILIFLPKKLLLTSFGIKDFHPLFYYLSMLGLCVLSGRLFALIQNAILFSEEKLKSLIRDLFDFILLDVQENDMIKEEKKLLYKDKSIELLKNALDNE
ncbi:conserved membrane hypothetical protein [Tenacibaculum litopenaei]|uniref:hypothetical protein n=1 Tax=Tenacibaculum litopenaei TaxID=396016 RepID=UPI00389384AF